MLAAVFGSGAGLWIWLLFAFVAVGAKLLLAAITIYLLLPTDPRCSRCDTETLLLQLNRGGRIASVLLLGRVQRRWCPRCGTQGLARTHALQHPRAPMPRGSSVPSRHQ